MNKTLLLFGAIGAYIAFGKKKPSSQTKETPIDTKFDKNKVEKKTYSLITASRKANYDKEILSGPVMFNLPLNILELEPIMNYNTWSKNGTEGLYQDWMAIMLYIQTAINEAKWDAETGELPLYLECGKKLEVKEIDPPSYHLVEFEETAEQCDERLKQARMLLDQISEYVKDTLPSCPSGGKCE